MRSPDSEHSNIGRTNVIVRKMELEGLTLISESPVDRPDIEGYGSV